MKKPAAVKLEETPELRLEYIDVEALADNPANWRTHPGPQLDALAAVIADVGWAGACLYNEHTGRLIDGHARKNVSKGKVPVLIGSWSEEDERKILATLDPLADMAEASEQALGELLASIETESEALQAMLDGLATEHGIDLCEPGAVEDPEPQIDRAAELQKEWGTELGQLWTIEGKAGEHRILCGDSTERVMGGEAVAMLLTDPPYGINVDASWFGGKPGPGMKNPKDIVSPFSKDGKAEWDTSPFDPSPFIGLAKIVAMFGANYFCHRLPDPGTWWVWDKRCSEAADALIGIPYEMVWINRKCAHRIIRYNWAGITARERGEAGPRHHVTQKPVAVVAELVEYLTEPGDVILDPFLGSGTTLVACEQLSRVGVGIEISPGYVAVALQRLKDLGLDPQLAEAAP